jgi:nickel-dependent lactate racemase
MRVDLCYGDGRLPIDIPSSRVTVLEPILVNGLPDEAEAFRRAVRLPIAARSLREIVGPNERLAVAIPDITRPLPSDRLLGWLLEELAHVPDSQWTIVNGTGSHRVNTEHELLAMVGPEVIGRCGW